MTMEFVMLFNFVVGYSVPNKAKLTQTSFESKLPSSHLEKESTGLPSSPFTSWTWMG